MQGSGQEPGKQSIGSHFHLESRGRNPALVFACVLMVFGAFASLSRRRVEAMITEPTGLSHSSSATARPQLYRVTFFLTEGNFNANESLADLHYRADSAMLLTVLHRTSILTFNSLGLEYTAIQYTVDDWLPVCLCGTQHNCPSETCESVLQPLRLDGPDEGTMSLQLYTAVMPGQQVVLHTSYVGSLALGLTRSAAFDYIEASTGAVHSQVLAAASLEPYKARRMLPCFDFPIYKASFSISIQAPANLVVLSNTAKANSQPGLEPGTLLHTFETSPKMSTYLMGVTVGHMVSSSAVSSSRKNISVWSVPSLAQQHSVALQAAMQGTQFYENYTGIVLPLQKLDFVAIPGRKGAVENWGLIQFDERRMLFNQATEGAYGRWLAADVVCHELAHQWFGNYVTCQDFDNIAVNEGLASFMEYKCLAAAFPEMPQAALFQLPSTPHGEGIGVHEGPRAHAMGADGTPFIEPLLSTHTPGFLSYHAEIPYSKGAAVMAMLEDYWESAGQNAFREGLRILMQGHGLGSATLDDVLMALLAGAQATISAVGRATPSSSSDLFSAPTSGALQLLRSWLTQPGVPLVKLSAADESSPPLLTQSRYYDWGQDTAGDPFVTAANDSSSWFVPVSVGRLGSPAPSGDGENTCLEILHEAQVVASFGNSSTEDLLLNAKGSGYYRVQYPISHQTNLIASLSNITSNGASSLPILLQASAFITDIIHLSFSSDIDPSAVLDTAAAVAAAPVSHTGFGLHLLVAPVVEALQQLTRLSRALSASDECRQQLQASAHHLLALFAQPILDRIAQEQRPDFGNKYGSSYSQSQDTFLFDHNKGKVLLAAAVSGHEPAADLLCRLYSDNRQEGAPAMDPDLLGAAYQAAVAHLDGCSTDPGLVWTDMLTKWHTHPDIQESERGLYALPWTADPLLLRQALDLRLKKETVVSRSPENVLEAMLANVGRNPGRSPGSDGATGADVAWQWVQHSFAGSNVTKILDALELLPFTPTQAHYDNLTHFLEQVQPGILGDTARKSRLLAKAQHQLTWVQQHMRQGSELCLRANELSAIIAGG